MSLADLLNQAAPGPWDWFGGYPQRVTNPAATLVAEAFDDPDSPPFTVHLIALAPDAVRLLVDMAADLQQWLESHGETEEGICGSCDRTRALLARFAEIERTAAK